MSEMCRCPAFTPDYHPASWHDEHDPWVKANDSVGASLDPTDVFNSLLRSHRLDGHFGCTAENCEVAALMDTPVVAYEDDEYNGRIPGR